MTAVCSVLGRSVQFYLGDGRADDWRQRVQHQGQAITREIIDAAKEYLIENRMVHLDQLADKLRGERVRRVIEPMPAGTAMTGVPEDDRRYLVDLGLLRRDGAGGLIVANSIYREALPRTLAGGPQDSLPRISPNWLNPDGSLKIGLNQLCGCLVSSRPWDCRVVLGPAAIRPEQDAECNSAIPGSGVRGSVKKPGRVPQDL